MQVLKAHKASTKSAQNQTEMIQKKTNKHKEKVEMNCQKKTPISAMKVETGVSSLAGLSGTNIITSTHQINIRASNDTPILS